MIEEPNNTFETNEPTEVDDVSREEPHKANRLPGIILLGSATLILIILLILAF